MAAASDRSAPSNEDSASASASDARASPSAGHGSARTPCQRPSANRGVCVARESAARRCSAALVQSCAREEPTRAFRSHTNVESDHSAACVRGSMKKAPRRASSKDQKISFGTAAISSANGEARKPGWNSTVRQSPPGSALRSSTMVVRPARASTTAADSPSAPAPMIAASYLSSNAFSHSASGVILAGTGSRTVNVR